MGILPPIPKNTSSYGAEGCTVSSLLQQTVGSGPASSFQQLEENTQEPQLRSCRLYWVTNSQLLPSPSPSPDLWQRQVQWWWGSLEKFWENTDLFRIYTCEAMDATSMQKFAHEQKMQIYDILHPSRCCRLSSTANLGLTDLIVGGSFLQLDASNTLRIIYNIED